MSGPVDVLAALENLARAVQADMDESDCRRTRAGIREARAAVAELVARFETVLEWCETIPDDDSRVPRQDMNAAYAALAKFGGAS